MTPNRLLAKRLSLATGAAAASTAERGAYCEASSAAATATPICRGKWSDYMAVELSILGRWLGLYSKPVVGR
eukprot:COSAG05_NODE_39_length_27555_cov_750.282925_14_plen_72_part_00